MATTKTLFIALVGAGMLAAALSGCEGTQSTKSGSSTVQPARSPETPSQTVRGWPSHRGDRTTSWSSIALPTGEAATSALGLEKGVPTEVWANQPFDYQIIATNLTGYDLEDVVVSDMPGANLKINSASPAGQAGAGNHVTWPLGTLKPGESKTIRVNASATATGSVGSCGTASYSAELCSVIPVVSPQLKIVKTGPAEVIKCDDILYRFQVTNTGTGSVRDVKITDPLPEGLTTRDNKNAIVIEVGEVKAGETKPFTAVVKAARTGRFEAKATATGSGGLTTASESVATTVRQPVLSLTTKCPEKQYIGRGLDYSITVTNTGDGVARDTVIEDTTPRGTSFVSASDGGRHGGGRVVWDLGELAPGATKTLTMKLMPESAAGMLKNTATAKASCAADATASCEHEVTGIPAILLEVVDVEDPAQVGTNTTYIITVTNQGTAPGTNIKVACRLEENQQHVSATGATEGTAANRTITFAPIPSLASKQKATFRVVAKNVRPGDVRFQVSMTSDQLTRNVEETEATFVYE